MVTESPPIHIRNDTQPTELQRILQATTTTSTTTTTPPQATLLMCLTLYCLILNTAIVLLTFFWHRIPRRQGRVCSNKNYNADHNHGSGRSLLGCTRKEPHRRNQHAAFRQSAFKCSINCGCCLYRTVCLYRRGCYPKRTISEKTDSPFLGSQTFQPDEENEMPSLRNQPNPISDNVCLPSSAGPYNSNGVNKTDFDASQLFLIGLIATFDSLTITAEYFIPAVVMFDHVRSSISYRTELNLGCRLTFMLITFSHLVTQWILVVYGAERILAVGRLWRSNRNSHRNDLESQQCPPYSNAVLNTLKLKIGMSLFIALSFSGICNYIWMIGNVTPIEYQLPNGSVVMQLELSCSLRQEYYVFYVKFLVYVEFILLVIIPNFLLIICTFVILFYSIKGLIYVFVRRRNTNCASHSNSENPVNTLPNHQTTQVTSVATSVMIKHFSVTDRSWINISTAMFIANSVIRISLSAGKDLDTFSAVFLGLNHNTPHNYIYTMSLWPTISTVNLALLCISLCIPKRRRRTIN
ncbi:unnamed protein product [Echinostoma caproni]|uniref:G_PROTEIN_RECEP_F1_2 domain-containing protein n=1 Tax=Echinostoma caproni TaxID=27848 RepID=A0A183AEN3_9TREM|nr:unnamed protein product [Echinostoma caproni]